MVGFHFDRKQGFMNAVMSVASVLVNGLAMFVLYRFLVKRMGIDSVGIWATVFAAANFTLFLGTGFSSGVVKFVAKYTARGEEENSNLVVQTAFIATSALFLFLLAASYPLLKVLLSYAVTAGYLGQALEILPPILFAVFFTVTGGVFQSALDGHQRIDLRCLVQMLNSLLFLAFGIVLVPSQGLRGVGTAFCASSIVSCLAGWLTLRQVASRLPCVPFQWNTPIFREIIGYGFNLQIIYFTSMFYDPVTKFLLTRFGGLSFTGVYEIASKIIQMIRGIIVCINQTVVPVVATLHEKAPSEIKKLYAFSYQTISSLSLLFYSLAVVCLPLLAAVFLGHGDSKFVFVSLLLVAGCFLNTLCAPAYFINLGRGKLLWNVVSHMAIAVSNVALGLTLGALRQGYGVIAGWTFSLILGSSIILLTYHADNGLGLRRLVSPGQLPLFLLFAASVAIVIILTALDVGLRVQNGILLPLAGLLVFFNWDKSIKMPLSVFLQNRIAGEAAANV